MKTLASNAYRTPPSLRNKTNVPNKSRSDGNSISDEFHLSSPSEVGQVAKPKASSGFLKKAILGGMAALSLATTLAPPVSAQALCIQAPCQVEQMVENFQHYDGAPVEMIRQHDGDVVFNVGINDQVVNPDSGAHYRYPGAMNLGSRQAGESVCEQALDLGGSCEGDNIGFVPTPHGTLIVEQNSRTSVDTYSMTGDHTRIESANSGMDAQTLQGNTFFWKSGLITQY